MGSQVESKSNQENPKGGLLLEQIKKAKLRYFGFTFFWVWMSLFMYNKAIFQEPEYLFPNPHIPLIVLTLSSFLTLVYVTFLMPKRLAPLSLRRSFKILAPTLTIAGTMIRSMGDAWTVLDPATGALAGSLVAGCGMIFIMLMWAEFYGSIGSYRTALYLPLSLVLAIPLFYLVTWMPSGLDVVLMCCLPVFAILCIHFDKIEIEEKDALSCRAHLKTPAGENGSTTQALLKNNFLLPWKICLAASLYGVISGLVHSTSRIDGGVTGLTQLGTIILSVLLVAGILIFGKPSQQNGFTYKPTLLVMAAGCISLLFLTDTQIAGAIVGNGYMLFYVLSFIMYSDVSFRLNLPSYKVFASGRLFGALGYACGMVFGQVFSQTLHLDIQRPEILSAVIVCLLLFTTIFVLDEKDVINTWGKKPQEISSRAASVSGLTPRESEVLELLAKGRSLPYIQEALHISYSTVSTHTASIYQKLGVHSKQELISLIEGQDDSYETYEGINQEKPRIS